MPVFPPISLRQPRPHDIVDDPVDLCGVGAQASRGSSPHACATTTARELREVAIRAGGTGMWGNFQLGIDLPGRPATARGTLGVFEEAQDGSGRELNKVVVPMVFGVAMIEPYNGFLRSTRWRLGRRCRA